MIQRPGLGIACALGAASLYGFIPNMVRAAYQNGVPPVESTFVRTAIVGIVFAIIAVMRGETLRVPKPAIASLAGQSLSTLVISVGYLASVQFIPVGLAVIIFFSFPVLIMLLAPVVEGHSPGLPRIAIALFAFAGLGVAIGPSFEALDVRGIALAAAAALACVLQFFSGRSISRYLTPTVFGSLVHLTILPATLLIALDVGGGSLKMFPGGTATSAGLMFMLAVGGLYVVAYMVQMLSLRFAQASTVAPYFNLEPVMTTAVAASLLGERLSLNQYAGGGMVLLALVTAGLLPENKEN